MSFLLHKLEDVGSTNGWTVARCAQIPSKTLVYTRNQTEGRGRNGRAWVSHPGESVAFSIVVDGLPSGTLLTWVPLLAGVSVVEIVKNLGVTGVSLKWPNDVLVDGKKLAGVLVEVLPDSRMVVGVGVNIDSSLDSLPHATATSLALQGIEVKSIERELLEPIALRLDAHLRVAFRNNSEYAHVAWKKVVADHLSTLGREVQWEPVGQAKKIGVVRDLAYDGGLVVREVSSLEDCVIRSGDVFHIERS